VSLEGGVRGQKAGVVGVEACQLVLLWHGVLRLWLGEREPRGGHRVGTIVDICQAFDLEALSHFKKRREVFLVHGNLASVHELQERLHLVITDILEEDNGMFVGGVVEHALEVGGARG